jgi:hypothetical protein
MDFNGRHRNQPLNINFLPAAVIMSDALVWHLIRDNNSFLIKRGRTNRAGAVQFSSEPGNLLNVNTFKYSGIANSKTISIDSDLVLKTKVVRILKIRIPFFAVAKISFFLGREAH